MKIPFLDITFSESAALWIAITVIGVVAAIVALGLFLRDWDDPDLGSD